MNKQLMYNVLYVCLIIAVIITLIFIIFWLQGIGVECVKDPITFYTERTNAVCNCFVAP